MIKYEKPIIVDLNAICKEGICFNGGGDRKKDIQ